MLGFKIKSWSSVPGRKADLFYLALLGIGLHFFFLTLFLVKKFFVVNYFANGGSAFGEISTRSSSCCLRDAKRLMRR
jgi:hypothetical protein